LAVQKKNYEIVKKAAKLAPYVGLFL